MTSPRRPESPAQKRGALRRLRKAYRRQEAIQIFCALVEKGISKRDASRECGFSYVTMWRFRRAHHTRGFAGLMEGQRPGKPSIASQLKPHLTPEVLAAVRQLAVETGSAASALRKFSTRADCPKPLADFLRKGRRSIPPSILKLVGLRKIRAIIFVAGDYSRTAEHAA